MKLTRAVLAPVSLMFALVLAGCGGGGSVSVQFNTPSSAQGVYEGTSSNGFAFNTLVLENDEYWTIYGQYSGGNFLVHGLIQGNGQSGSGSFSSSNLKDFYYTGAVYTGGLSASYIPGVSFNGTISTTGSTSTFTATPLTSSLYNYNAAAELAAVSGAWNLTELRGANTTMNIAAGGTFTGNAGGCTFSGTLTPRPSGKNVFNVAAQFGPFPCALAGQAVTGIALSYILSDGRRQFLLGAVDSQRNNATVLMGAR